MKNAFKASISPLLPPPLHCPICPGALADRRFFGRTFPLPLKPLIVPPTVQSRVPRGRLAGQWGGQLEHIVCPGYMTNSLAVTNFCGRLMF